MKTLIPLIALLAASPAAAAQARVTAGSPQEAAEDRLLEIYDIADLVDADEDQLVRMKRELGEDLTPAALEEMAAAWREERIGFYEQAARTFMRPALDPQLDSLLASDRGLMVLNGTREHHAWLAGFLELQRSPMNMARIDFTIVSGPAERLDDLGLEGSSSIIEESLERERLMEACQEADSVDVLSAPSVVVVSSQRATISILNQVAYVKEWKLVVVQPGGIEIADPIIDVVQDGLMIDCSYLEVEPGVHAVEVDFKSSSLERPIESEKIRIGAGGAHEVEVGRPVVTSISLETKLILGQGATAVLRSASGKDDVDIAILIQLAAIDLEDREEMPAGG